MSLGLHVPGEPTPPAQPEAALWSSKPSTFADLPTTLIGMRIAAAGYFGLEAMLAGRVGWPDWTQHIPNTWWWGCLALTVGKLRLDWVQNATTRYTLTTERLLVKRGILSVSTDEVELYRVRDYRIDQPLLLRLFGLGRLSLVTADVSTPLLILDAQPDVEALRDLIREQVLQHQQSRGWRELEVT